MENLINDFRLDVVESTPCVLDITATLTGEGTKRVAKKVRNAYLKEATLPGFRAGKIPPNLFEAKFGENMRKAVDDEVRHEVYNRTIEGLKRNFLDYPSIKSNTPEKAESGKDYTMLMTVEAAPELTLPDYKELTATQEKHEVTENEINETIDSWRQQMATVQKVERPVQTGDMLKVSLKSDADEALLEAGKDYKYLLNVDDTWLILNPPEMLPGATAALAGHNLGDTVTFPVTFPQEHYAEILRGKTLNYTCEIKEIHATEMPALDDELAKKAGCENLDQFKENVKKNLQARQDADDKATTIDKLIDALLEKIGSFPLPPQALQRQTDMTLERLKRENKNKGNVNEDELKEKAGKDSEKAFRISIVLEEIASKESLTISPEKMMNAVTNLATQYGKTPDDILNQLRKNDQLGKLHRNLLLDEAAEFLFKNADVK